MGQLAETRRPIIDGLALPAFAGMDDALAARNAVALIPPSDGSGNRLSAKPRSGRDCSPSRSACCRRWRVSSSPARLDRRAARRGFRRGSRQGSASWCRAPTTRRAARLRRPDLPHHLGRHAGAAQGPRRAAARSGAAVRSGLAAHHRRLARPRSGARALAGGTRRGARHRAGVGFAGEATDAALDALWREADLFALATHWEGYGMAIAEALKRGLPVAVTKPAPPAALVTPEVGRGVSARRSRQSLEGAAPGDLRHRPAAMMGGGCVAGRADSAKLADAGGNVRSGPDGVTERFERDWLALREPFDHAALNVALARRLADRPAGRPRLIDLGAGTGSLFRYLAPIIGRRQDWVLVDADAALLDDAFGRTAAWARRQGFAATSPGDALLVHTPRGLWRMQVVQRDLAAVALSRMQTRCCAARCSTWCRRRGSIGWSIPCTCRSSPA